MAQKTNWFELNPKKTIALLIILTVPFLILGIEILARLFNLHHSTFGPDYFQLNADGSMSIIPNYTTHIARPEFEHTIRINDGGIRDERPMKDILSFDGGKILFLGDSFTFGQGVEFEEMYSSQLERLLNNSNKRYVVFSTGSANGSFPSEYEFFLNKNFHKLKPNLVILGLFIHNDLTDPADYQIVRDAQGNLKQIVPATFDVVKGYLVSRNGSPNENRGRAVIVRSWLIEHSFIYNRYQTLRRVIKNRVNQQVANREHLPYFFLDAGPRENDLHYKESLFSLYRINQFLKERNTPFVVFIIPENFQINAHYQDAQTKFFNMSEQDMLVSFKKREPQTAIEKFLEENRIRFIDPIDDFRKLDKENHRLYYKMDGHLTKKGHAEAARLIYTYLNNEKLLK